MDFEGVKRDCWFASDSIQGKGNQHQWCQKPLWNTSFQIAVSRLDHGCRFGWCCVPGYLSYPFRARCLKVASLLKCLMMPLGLRKGPGVRLKVCDYTGASVHICCFYQCHTQAQRCTFWALRCNRISGLLLVALRT